jgi:hypothetical protein
MTAPEPDLVELEMKIREQLARWILELADKSDTWQQWGITEFGHRL